MIHFLLRAKDPDKTYCSLMWQAAIVPRIGDSIYLPDGTEDSFGLMGWQEVQVKDILLYPYEHPNCVVVWIGDFQGWAPQSVRELFYNAYEWLRNQKTMSIS